MGPAGVGRRLHNLRSEIMPGSLTKSTVATAARKGGKPAKPVPLLGLVLARLQVGPPLLIALDATPTKLYGPHVEGAGIHHNPTPGPGYSMYVYGHIWVTLVLILRHMLWGTIGLPVLAELYMRLKDLAELPRYLPPAVSDQASTGRRADPLGGQLGRCGRKPPVDRGRRLLCRATGLTDRPRLAASAQNPRRCPKAVQAGRLA